VLSTFSLVQRNAVAAAIAAAFLAAIFAAGAPALAQGDDMSRAKEAFSRGQTAFDAGRYEEARAAFEESLAAFPHFRTLFNIALCAEKLGDVRTAVAMYQRYVDWPSEVPNREEIAAKLAQLQATLPKEPAPEPQPVEEPDEPEPPIAPPAPRPEPGKDLRIPGWIAVGTGAAGVVVGAVFLGLAQKKKKEMEGVDGETYDPSVHDAIPEDGRLYEKVGWIVGGVGVVAAAVGTVLLLASDDEPKKGAPAAIAPAVGPGAVAATVRWSF
jgi:tetratricopeptide (TPR) repeat protein